VVPGGPPPSLSLSLSLSASLSWSKSRDLAGVITYNNRHLIARESSSPRDNASRGRRGPEGEMSGCQKRSPLCSPPTPRVARHAVLCKKLHCAVARASARLASPPRAAAVNRIALHSSIVYEHRCRRRKCNGTRFPRLSRLLIPRDTRFSVAGTPATRAASGFALCLVPRCDEITRKTGKERGWRGGGEKTSRCIAFSVRKWRTNRR